jgi:hypothetical protein
MMHAVSARIDRSAIPAGETLIADQHSAIERR